MARTVLAMAAVFLVWMGLSYVLHGVILTSSYMASAALWRPLPEMQSRMWLIYLSTLVSAVAFVLVYDRFIPAKSWRTALAYGLILGIATGMSWGYGSYAMMPIPYALALGWFLGSVVNYAIGGLVMAAVLGTWGKS
jgi:hypothetical protein